MSIQLLSLVSACGPVPRWASTVGPPAIHIPDAPSPVIDNNGRLVVVNWNMHVGHGDIARLIRELSREEKAKGFGDPEFVLLLQESFRRGAEVPSAGKIDVPKRISPPESAKDIDDIARQLNWWLYYVPSMRNGTRAGDDGEDRGNAILSSLPLSRLEAIELPFAVQRRVALVATVMDGQNTPRLRVAVAHLDTRAPISKGWIFGGPVARKRQARGIIDALKKHSDDELPFVLGADLNTPFGIREPAVETVATLVPRRSCGKKSTHTSGLVLDHVFARLPETWSAAECTRINNTFGSDHYPLVLPMSVPW